MENIWKKLRNWWSRFWKRLKIMVKGLWERLKDLVTKNFGIKLLSLLLAVIAWGFITNIDNPQQLRTISGIPVQVLNDDVVTDQGKVYEILQGASVDVQVRARRNQVSSLSADSFIATADFQSLYHEVTPIEIQCRVSNVEIVERSVQNMRISVDDVSTKQFFVTMDQQGQPKDGYVVSSVKATPNVIQITGAQSKLEMIDTVRVILNVNNVSTDFNADLEPRLCEKDGSYMDSRGLTFSEKIVHVEANVEPSKMVSVKVTPTGTPAYGYEVIDTTFEPASVEVAGSKDALKDFDTINVPVDITDQAGTVERILNLAEYVPEGVRLVDNKATVTVRVLLEQKVTRAVSFPVGDIEIRGLLENYECRFLPDTDVAISLYGLQRDLDKVTVSDLAPYIDVTDLTAGTHTVMIFAKTPENLSIVNTPVVVIQLIDLTQPVTEETTAAETTEPEE